MSDHGRMPLPVILDKLGARRDPGRGEPGDRIPPCAVQRLGHLSDWREPTGVEYPADLGPLWLFKCRQMFLLVVPGLGDVMSAPAEQQTP